MIEVEMENLKKHHANLLLSQNLHFEGELDKNEVARSSHFAQDRLEKKDAST